MVTVRVPLWAATNQQFKFHVTADPNMPQAATNSPTELTITGFELISAAIFSGRPSHLLQNPQNSSNAAFAQWRATSCLHHLEPVTINNSVHLRRPTIFHTEVDPTEKGYLNFSLGSTLTLAYLKKKLGIRWLAHYSLLSNAPQYNVVRNAPGRIEPDYIGLDSRHHFVAAEAKGRMILDSTTRTQLQQKTQTGVVNSVNNQRILRKYGIAAIVAGPSIELFATDPEIEVALPTPRAWVNRYYEYVRAVCGEEIDEINTTHERIAENESEFEWAPVQISLPDPVRAWSSELIPRQQEHKMLDGELGQVITEEEWRQIDASAREYFKTSIKGEGGPTQHKEYKGDILSDLVTITTVNDHRAPSTD